MGVIIPQVVTSDRASGALVIDGSLKFDESQSQHLIRTFGAGNRRTWTHSSWVKQGDFGRKKSFFMVGPSSGLSNTNYLSLDFDDNDNLRYAAGGENFKVTAAKFRDTGWYHVVWACDTTQAAAVDRTKIYVNGELITAYGTSSSNPTQNQELAYNENNVVHRIGTSTPYNNDREWNDAMSQVYFLDGLAIGPSYFGYTDPLTNTWRPKKFRAEGTTVNDGTEWTTKMSNTTLIYAGTAANVYNGNITPWTTDNYVSYNSGVLTLLTGVNIEVKNSIRIYGNWLAGDFIVINGVNYDTDANGAQNWISPIGVPYPINITSLAVDSTPGGVQNSLSGVEIDGVIMKDSTTQNLDFGTNGFYLPFDGKAPIGEDQSGKGNNWEAVNFGGSTDITKATGAKPILNTLGGNIARPGVFGSDVGAYYHTTSGSNSGGKYVFEVQGTQPTFSFIRGATYVFDWSASSSHPIRFATAADAAGSTEYTDGTNVTGNVTTITVPHNAPDTLYYYCNVHSGMGNSISVTTDETKADPYAWKCTLAIPFIGDTKDHSGDINCTVSSKATGSDNLTFSTPGDMFYGLPVKLLGNGSSNSRVTIASGAFGFGTGDFTIEFWGHFTATGDQGNRNARIITPQSESGTYIQILTSNSNATVQLNNVDIPNAEALNKTRHYVFQRSGTTGELIVDGVLVDTGTENRDFPDVAYQVGRYSDTNGGASMYMADLRVYTGVKKYSTTGKTTGDPIFVPASPSPDIRPDSPSGVAPKSKLTEVTEGSVSFDGTGDYLATYTSSSELTFGTGDFTVEMFLYNEETAGKGFIQFSDSEGGLKGTSSGVITIHKDNGQNGVFRAYAKNTSTAFATPVPYKRWCHVALTRESGTVKLFVDGKQDSTTITSDTTDYATTYVVIGGYYDTDYLSKCSISNVRVNKGTAVYTRDFKPPTRQLTNISGTKLLCCHSNSQPGAGITAPNMGGVNSGVQWSAGAGPNFEAANPARDGFNGKVDSNTRTDNADVTATVNFPVPVAFSSTLKVRGARDSGNGRIILIGGNGQVDVSSQFTSSSASLETVTITGVTSPLKGISLIGISGAAQPRFSAIYIDDVMLVDPLTPNGDVSVSSNAARINSATSFNPFTTDIDTVQGQAGSYCTMSDVSKTKSQYFCKDGGLTVGNSDAPSGSSGSRGHIRSTIGMKTGKWYAEVTPFRASDGDFDFGFGLFTADNPGFWNTKGTINYRVSGTLQAPSGLNQTYGTSSADGDCIGIKVDLDSLERTVEFSKNGVPMGPVGITTTHELFFGYGSDGGGGGRTYTTKWNFGQKPFKYPPRDGFQPLTSTTIRPETVIVRPEEFVGVSTYVGNETTQLINNFNNMQPDLVWIKNRDDGISNMIYDSVRGANNYIRSDTTNIQDAGSSNQVSFNPKGFTVTGGGGGVNDDNKRFISWTWKAGGNKGTFNLDDVGYSSASSVGMNVGGKNGEAYITGTYTSKWDAAGSTGAVDNGSRAFNGDKSNYASCQNSSTKTIWRPDTPIKVNKSLRVYASGISSGNNQVFVNGTSLGSVTNSAVWYTVNADYLIEIAIADTGSTHGRLWAVEVDGRLLLDSAQTPTDNFPTIASTGSSVGTKQGFSIVQYTGNSTAGATVAHGLSQTPDFVIVKQISGTDESWRVRHAHMGDLSKTLYLNQTVGNTSNTERILDAGAATITLSSGANGINSGSNYIVYSWHDVPGLQKFGMYEGTADSNGPVLETGFRPALVVLKKTTEDGDPWIVYDAARNSSNLATRRLQWNNNNNESMSVDYAIDILSNGFKIRTSDVSWNDDGERFIYMAWAEAPAFNLFGAQSNAR